MIISANNLVDAVNIHSFPNLKLNENKFYAT